MKYVFLILLSILFCACKTSVQKRDEKITGVVKQFFNKTKLAQYMVADSVIIVSADSLSVAKRLEMEIKIWQEETKTETEYHFPDSMLAKSNKVIAILKAIKPTNDFWGYYVNARVYSHSVTDHKGQETVQPFFISKDYKIQ
jgi:hypothetical protein